MSQIPHSVHRIGLIADTHGSLSAIERSTDALMQQEVDLIIHLGDFCDSIYHDELPEILDLIQRMRIRVVKGNNDYQVEKMLQRGYSEFQPEVRRQWLSFLKKVPITITLGSIRFSHSMPYDTIRSFYEPVDTGSTEIAEQIFRNTTYPIFFCGHSHMPILFRFKSGRVTREPMASLNRVGIETDQRYIFIIGSAVEGECGFLDLTESRYVRLGI